MADNQIYKQVIYLTFLQEPKDTSDTTDNYNTQTYGYDIQEGNTIGNQTLNNIDSRKEMPILNISNVDTESHILLDTFDSYDSLDNGSGASLHDTIIPSHSTTKVCNA